MIEAVERARSSERDWWLRALLVLQSPRTVFAALRDDSRDAAVERQEPAMAIAILAGIAGVLMTSVAGRLLDDPEYDALVLLVYLFVAGVLHGFVGMFLLGGLLYFGASLAGSLGSFRRARHVVVFAAVPIALTLVVWPVRLALYGGDLFRRGGSDSGAGAAIFEWIEWAAVAWAFALLVVGVRVVHGWSWGRTAVALVLPALPLALVLADVLGAFDQFPEEA